MARERPALQQAARAVPGAAAERERQEEQETPRPHRQAKEMQAGQAMGLAVFMAAEAGAARQP